MQGRQHCLPRNVIIGAHCGVDFSCSPEDAWQSLSASTSAEAVLVRQAGSLESQREGLREPALQAAAKRRPSQGLGCRVPPASAERPSCQHGLQRGPGLARRLVQGAVRRSAGVGYRPRRPNHNILTLASAACQMLEPSLSTQQSRNRRPSDIPPYTMTCPGQPPAAWPPRAAGLAESTANTTSVPRRRNASKSHASSKHGMSPSF